MSQTSSKQGGLTPGRIVVAVAGGLIVLFAVLNSQSVEMHWLVATSTTPLFVVLLVFALLGFAVGYVVGRRGGR